MRKRPTRYWKGDLARYTGKTEELYGATFYEIELLEGPRKGCKPLVIDRPEHSHLARSTV